MLACQTCPNHNYLVDCVAYKEKDTCQASVDVVGVLVVSNCTAERNCTLRNPIPNQSQPRLAYESTK
jgi:hypothetical protein